MTLSKVTVPERRECRTYIYFGQNGPTGRTSAPVGGGSVSSLRTIHFDIAWIGPAGVARSVPAINRVVAAYAVLRLQDVVASESL